MSNEHYDVGGISVIEVIRAKLTPEQLKGFYLGQVIKYGLRANHKDDFEDDASKLADYATWLRELSCDAGTSKPVDTNPTIADLGSQGPKLRTPDIGDEGINGIFAARRDPYKDFAARYEDVTKEERILSKPPTLGCGYGLGADGLVGDSK